MTHRRSKTFNGEDVNYLFGLAYVSLFEPERVSVGEHYEMNVEISDPDGDPVELLIPGAPPGLTMDKHSHQEFGTFQRSFGQTISRFS